MAGVAVSSGEPESDVAAVAIIDWGSGASHWGGANPRRRQIWNRATARRLVIGQRTSARTLHRRGGQLVLRAVQFGVRGEEETPDEDPGHQQPWVGSCYVHVHACYVWAVARVQLSSTLVTGLERHGPWFLRCGWPAPCLLHHCLRRLARPCFSRFPEPS